MALEAVPADTTPEAAAVQLRIYRLMPPARRLEVALELSESLRRMVAAGVRSRHPAYTEDQVRRAVLRLTLGAKLFDQACPGGDRGMTQEDLLADIVRHLETAGIPFMVTGSYGSSFHGQPRATNDLDIVIDPTAEQLDAFVASLGERYYVSPAAAREAFARRSMFNLIDFGSGWKADMILRKDRPFSVEEFRRRRQGVDLHGCRVAVASPEDVILSKLEWDKITPSERQVQDALNVAVVQGTNLDQDYLRRWAAVLGVAAKLETVLHLASQTQPPPGP
jgi:hypothetical protein